MIQQINDSLETLKPTPVTITAASEQDKIDFDLADFIYAHVDGNYVEFFLLNEDGNVECHIKRNTLKNVEEQLEKFGRVLRVHRSYLVNCNYIAKVEGNAQGYRLTFPGVEEKVAVSRRYISRFDNVMNG
jgi:DNA-binding LytR/AlgR family response regulator